MYSLERDHTAKGEPALTLVVRNLSNGTFVLTYRRRELPILAEDLRGILEGVLELDPATIVIEIATRAEVRSTSLADTLDWIAREMRDRRGDVWLGFPDPTGFTTSLIPVAEALAESRPRLRRAIL